MGTQPSQGVEPVAAMQPRDADAGDAQSPVSTHSLGLSLVPTPQEPSVPEGTERKASEEAVAISRGGQLQLIL
mgnify:CR=1 FL=1